MRLDTKYKGHAQPKKPDLNQAVAYAAAKRCAAAMLVYPTAGTLDIEVGDVHVHRLGFCLDGDLDVAGERFLAELLSRVTVPGNATTPWVERTRSDERRGRQAATMSPWAG